MSSPLPPASGRRRPEVTAPFGVKYPVLAWGLGLPGCHTQGRTREELRERIKEAIALYSGLP